jgi:SNF2 family DNA or RNA helicase
LASFDKIDGVFTTRFADGKSGIKPNDRFMFRRNGWEWNVKRKGWETTEEEKARPLYKHAVGAAKEYLDNVESMRQAMVDASWAEDTDAEFPSPDGLTYMPFQKAGIEYAIKRDKTLIADPPGLGKTIQAIGVHNTVKMSRVLVICPASLKVNWKREWEKWDVHGLTVGIASSRPRSKTVEGITERWTEYNWPDTDVVVINYDMLETFDDDLKEIDWDLLICDEAHLLKSKNARRSKCIFGGSTPARRKDGKLVKKAKDYAPIDATRTLYLTGTPVLSRPLDIWNLIRSCDPKGLGKNKEDFQFRYCGAYYIGDYLDASGASHEEELGRLMRERFMVRRDKKSVLKDLPDKTREMILLPQDKLEAPIRREKTRVETALSAYEDLVGIEKSDNEFRYIKAIEDLSDKLARALELQNSEEPDWDKAVKTLDEPDQILFTEISEAREEVALAKVAMVAEHVQKLYDAEEPVILFAYHKSVVAELQKRLEGMGMRVGIVTGSVAPNKRQKIVDDFQDGVYDVILGNIMAMGTGFTLTRASIVVFAELDWVPAQIEQAEDRAWRYGQKNAVLIQHLVVDGSIEARMAMALLDKMGIISAALDSR